MMSLPAGPNLGSNFTQNLDPSILHPADNLYLYTLKAETPDIPLRPGHPSIIIGLRRGANQRHQLSIRPDSIVRLKSIDGISSSNMLPACLKCTYLFNNACPIQV